MALSFQGISSGLPTDQLIQAMLAQQAVPIDRLQARQSANNLKKATLTSIKNTLTALAASVSSLTSATLNKRAVTSSDPSAVSATASGAQSGTYDVQVGQLATKARLETNTSLASPAASVGAAGDTYTITNKDGATKNIVLEEGKTSLADLADAINASSSDFGVTASVVQKSPGQYHLVLSSTETGKGVGGGDTVGISGNGGPADISYGGVSATAAKNAEFTLNGVAMERTSNTVSDAVDGVTFTLGKAGTGNVSLRVDLDTDAVAKAFQDVVNKYNSAYNAYKSASGKGGSLSGDLSVQAIFSQLRSAITGTVESAGVTQSMALLGMSTNRDGTLSLDTTKLEEALRGDPGMVGRVFDKASSDTKDLIDRLTTAGGGTLTAIISGIDSTNALLSKQIDSIQAKIDRRQEVLKAQFAKLEGLIGQMQSAGQSLAALW